MKHTVMTILTAITFFNGSIAQAAEFDPSTKAQAVQQGLQIVEKASFDEVLIGDLDALTEVNHIYIAELNTADLSIDKPSSTRTIAKDWELDQQEIQGLQALYIKTVSKKLALKGNFNIVDRPTENSLNIYASLVHLDPIAPRDNFESRGFQERYFTQGSGEMTVSFKVDYQGETVLLAIDEITAGNNWIENKQFNNKHNARTVFSRLAGRLGKQLDLI
ncbi:MAG: hypothetical protein AAF431_07435 [Pseudomonadota bacterium]